MSSADVGASTNRDTAISTTNPVFKTNFLIPIELGSGKK